MTVSTAYSLAFSRRRVQECDTVVLHATAGPSFKGAYQALKSRELSYHAIIEDQKETDGLIRKLVPLARVAFHAGKSMGPHGPNVNNYSIGISFVNRNDGLDGYSAAQYEAAREYILECKKQFPKLRYLTTHAAISPGRKFDPRNFPAKQLAVDCGLEWWG